MFFETIANVLASVTGNAIFKTANLPAFDTNTAISVGSFGGFLASLTLLAPLVPIILLCAMVDAKYRDHYRSTGVVSKDSNRQSGHFPVLIFSVPILFIICVLSTPLGTIIKKGSNQSITKLEATRIAAVGGAVVAPLLPFICILPLIVTRSASVFARDLAHGYPGKPSKALSFLERQWEALCWLVSARSRRRASARSQEIGL